MNIEDHQHHQPYHPLIKHGVLENGLCISDFPRKNSFSSGVFQLAMLKPEGTKNVVEVQRYPLVMTNIPMENHHALHGATHYF